MRIFRREISKTLWDVAGSFPAVVLTGPRRAGKSTVLQTLFPRAQYVLLENPDIQSRVRADPRAFLDGLARPAILDEIQNVPELLPYIRTRIDKSPRLHGQWLITGSQEAPLMQGVTESMTGRAAILQLLPLSLAETGKVTILAGGFPEAIARPKLREVWFSSYIQTYLERDVRAITNVRDLATFRRFLALVASRHGQQLNRQDLAAPLGITGPTANEWLRILEITGQVILVPPYFTDFGKRLVKSPKVYICDSGMACHLLGIQTQAELERSPFLGAIFEGFVASEILKSQINRGARKELYYFRDEQGLEVDFLFPERGSALHMVECKASRTVDPAMAKPMMRLHKAMDASAPVRATVVHRPSRSGPDMRAILPGAEAVDVDKFIHELRTPPAKERTGIRTRAR